VAKIIGKNSLLVKISTKYYYTVPLDETLRLFNTMVHCPMIHYCTIMPLVAIPEEQQYV
jgi:hypothetical protein